MAFAFMLLVGATLALSTLQVRFATRVEGPEVWPPGGRVSLRVGVRDLGQEGWEPGFRASAALRVDGKAPLRLAGGRAGRVGTLDLDFEVPAELPSGPATLEVTVRTVRGELERVEVPVVLGDPPPPGPWLFRRHPCEEGSRRDGEAWGVAPQCRRGPSAWLYPESGHLVGNLENRVRVLGDFQGLTVGIRRVSQPLPGHAPPDPGPFEARPVDALGLAEWTLTPGWPRKLIAVEGAGPPQFLRDLPTQALLSPRVALLAPGLPLRAELDLVRRGRPVWLEVWHQGRRIGADDAWVGGGPLDYGVRLPRPVRGFVVLAAVTSLEAPAAAGDRQVFFVSDETGPGASLLALARAVDALPAAPPLAEGAEVPRIDPLAARILALPPDRLARLDRATANRAAAALLSRVEARLPTPPPLAETTESRRTELAVFKRRVRRPLLGGLAGLVVGTLLVATWSGLRERRSRRLRLESLGLDEVEVEGRRGRVSGGTPVLGVLGLALVVLGALAALLTLLETLRWDWGS